VPTAQINGHKMYYEIHGEGPPALCMGGWGTYCHGGERNLARGLTDRYSVLIFDYRGIEESDDDPSVTPSVGLHAQDAAGLLDHLGWQQVHVTGLVGIGACIGAQLAVDQPELVRSLVMMGCWSHCDNFLRDQLEFFRDTHREAGFFAFQKAVTLFSFKPEFYNANKQRLLGPDGGWKELNENYPALERFVEACTSFDIRDRLGEIKAPSLMINAAHDHVTSPRYTGAMAAMVPGCEQVTMDVAHVIAGKEEKIAFCDILLPWLEKH